MDRKYLTILNIIAVVVVLVVNGLANALPLNGLTTGEISDRFQVYFVPAGYVFSIWGLIYIGLIAFVVYQALPKQRDNPRLQRISYGFVVSCLANAVWIFLWHYERFPLTLVAMLALLLSLIFIYLRLDIEHTEVTTLEKVCVDIPFSIYLGWVTVATIANITSLLDYVNWGGWGIGPQVWTVIMLIAATGITAAVGFTRGDIAYMLVIVWAFIGIAVKHADTPTVALSAWGMTVIVVAVIVLTVIRRLKRPEASAPAGA